MNVSINKKKLLIKQAINKYISYIYFKISVCLHFFIYLFMGLYHICISTFRFAYISTAGLVTGVLLVYYLCLEVSFLAKVVVSIWLHGFVCTFQINCDS